MSLKAFAAQTTLSQLRRLAQGTLTTAVRRRIHSLLARAARLRLRLPSNLERRLTRVEPRLALRKRLRTETLTETEMPRGFPLTGGGGFSSVSHYTDKLKSNARALAKMTRETGRYYNMDNGSVVMPIDYGELRYKTVFSAFHTSEIDEYFAQFFAHSGVDDTDMRAETLNVYIKDLWAHVDIVNSSNVAVYLEVLDIRPSKDLVGSSGIRPDPAEFYRVGIEDLLGSEAAELMMMHDLYMSRAFTNNFHVYKTTKVMLAPGEWHTHRVHFAPNMLVNRRDYTAIDEFNKTIDWLHRLAYFTMIRAHGAPVITKHAEPPDTANYSKAQLGICWWSKVEFGFGSPNGDDLYITDNLSVTPVTGAETVRPDGEVIGVEMADP